MNNKATCGLAALLFLGMVGGSAFHLYGGSEYVMAVVDPDTSGQMAKTLTAIAARNRSLLPTRISEHMTLVDEAVDGKKLTYVYTLQEDAVKDFTENDGLIKLDVARKVCNSMLAPHVRQGAVLSFIYMSADRSKKVAEFSVGQCGQA